MSYYTEAPIMRINDWMVDLNDELERINVSKNAQKEQWNKPSIYKLPDSSLTAGPRKAAYLPQTVSFGPYHHEDEQLRKMEYHKRRALRHFLHRSGYTLQTLVDAVLLRLKAAAVPPDIIVNDQAAVPPPVLLVKQLMDCYDSLDDKWRNNDQDGGFLKLMILDGCFMLEVLQWSDRADAASASAPDHDDRKYCYAPNDPIFSHHGKLYFMSHIRRDMLILENQLPMLLLRILLAVETNKEQIDEEHLNNIILNFCTNTKKQGVKLGTCLHVLDVYRKSLLIDENGCDQKIKIMGSSSSSSSSAAAGNTSTTKSNINVNHHSNSNSSSSPMSSGRGGRANSSPNSENIIRSAVNLHEAGIKFKISSGNISTLTNISFQGQELRLPVVVIDDTTESTFLNLMAFERFHVGAGNEITSYVCFMDNIIDSADDVKILRCSGIVYNAIGSDKAVAKLFNEMTKDVTPDPDSQLEKVEGKLNDYCKNPWHQWRANLLHTYFHSPWALLSLLAAVLLLVLTIVQTYFTIFPINNDNNKK